MISLQPREQFMILRKLGDHTDETTYYVQAVVRDSVSGEIIDTLNLTDAGDRRFYKLYEVPSDISGLGFYIDIETSVYTDDTYSTKAPTYGDELEQYLVFDRIVKTGGGGSVDVDYKKIEKILAKAMEPLLKDKKIDFGPVLAQIKGVMMAVEAIEMPEIDPVDHTPVLEAIRSAVNDLGKAIADKPVTPVTELGGLQKAISEAIKAKEPNLEKVFKGFEDLKKILTDHTTEYSQREGAKEKLDEIKNALSGVFAGENFKPTPIKKQKDGRISKLLGTENDDE